MPAGTGRVAVSGRVPVSLRGPFIPPQLANLLLWVDFSDANSITKTGNNVSSVTDKSGNGWTLSKGSTSPQYVAASLNGLSGISFTDQIHDRLASASSFSLSSSMTIYSVWSATGI